MNHRKPVWLSALDHWLEGTTLVTARTVLHDMMNAPVAKRRPTIGVFDSGFGGLTVLKALLEVIPGADFVYFGDTARLPYGSKSVDTVARYAVESSIYIESNGAQLLVIACNTGTALALDRITAATRVPVIGVVEPGADSGAAASKNKRIVVIGTEATVSSHAYAKALAARGMQATEKACPLLVPLVEEGWVEHPVTKEVAGIYLGEAFQGEFEDPDVLLLGCTHYPLLKPLLHSVPPAHVTIVDSAGSTAKAVAARLGAVLPQVNNGDDERRAQPPLKFFPTVSVEKFQPLGHRLLGRSTGSVQPVGSN